jgi:hypothetical protein
MSIYLKSYSLVVICFPKSVHDLELYECSDIWVEMLPRIIYSAKSLRTLSVGLRT